MSDLNLALDAYGRRDPGDLVAQFLEDTFSSYDEDDLMPLIRTVEYRILALERVLKVLRDQQLENMLPVVELYAKCHQSERDRGQWYNGAYCYTFKDKHGNITSLTMEELYQWCRRVHDAISKLNLPNPNR